jgi:hypothetical protein
VNGRFEGAAADVAAALCFSVGRRVAFVMRLRLLRLALGFSAFAWGVSVFGVFMPWPEAVRTLKNMGAMAIPNDPMLQYWLRMASGAFALVGVWFGVMAIRPRMYHAAIPWFGGLMLVEGLILGWHGLALGLPPLPFYGDVTACLLGGGLISWTASAACPDSVSPEQSART